MPRPIQFLLNGSDITTSIKEAVIERQEKRGADSCKFVAPGNASVNVNDDLRVKETAGGTYVFGGRVVEVSKEYDLTRCVALSYGKVFDELRVVPPIIYVNSSPESIVNDLRSRFFSDFSLSSATSGVTIDRYEATGTISENLRILADLAGFDFWTELNTAGNKILYFRPANTNLGRTLYLGKVGANNPNALRVNYELDDSQLFNVAEVYGRSKFEDVYYRWDYTGPGVGSILLPLPITSIRLAVRGVNLVEGVNFIYRPEQRALYFYDSATNTYYNVSGSETDPTTIEVSGFVDKTPAAYAENSASIAAYGKRMATIIIDKMYRDVDVNSFAQKFVQIYGSPRLTLVVKKPGLDFGIRNGGFVKVYLPYLGINGSNFVVRVVRWKYPEGVTEIVLSQFEPELYDFQRGILFRVESSTKSYVSSRDFGILEKKFYLKGDTVLDETLQTFAYRSRLRTEVTTPTAYVRLRLQIIGDTTVEYTTPTTAAAHLSDPSNSNKILPFFLSPLEISEVTSSSGQITIRAQFYIASSYGSTTQYLIAPDPSVSSQFFSTTVSAKRLLNTTIGGVVYFQLDQSFSPPLWRMHWGAGYAPALLFGFGFKT